ncbi:MAG: hypothetical protein K0S71_1438 [Clostridia bacterium]|jgi:hypothetical protein|nr:hypothetical protein [Clostridia bacterium]
MKSLKHILFIVAVVLVLGSQLFYVLTVRQDLKRQILDNEDEIMSTRREIMALKERLEGLPQTEEELSRINEEKSAVLNTIPTSASVTKEFVQINNLMELNNFFKVKLEHSEDIIHEDEIGSIIEKKYTLTYVTTFTQSKQFIEDLNASYEIINIQNCSIDNAVQTSEEAKLIRLWYGDKANELVTTKLDFTLFARPNDAAVDEIYEPEFNLFHNTEGAFLNRDLTNINEDTNLPIPGDHIPSPDTNQNQGSGNRADSNGKFRLDILDSLTSGDTYKFLGPGNGPNSYTGLLSSADTYITVSIKDSGYDVVLEDENGKVEQNSVLMPIKDLSLTIYSQMRQLEAVMPQVHIYIRDYTSEPIKVTLNGTLLENIHIYNEFDEEVFKGQTKGKVKLT